MVSIRNTHGIYTSVMLIARTRNEPANTWAIPMSASFALAERCHILLKLRMGWLSLGVFLIKVPDYGILSVLHFWYIVV